MLSRRTCNGGEREGTRVPLWNVIGNAILLSLEEILREDDPALFSLSLFLSALIERCKFLTVFLLDFHAR